MFKTALYTAIIFIPLSLNAVPTARTGIYLCNLHSHEFCDSIVEHYELIITYDFLREYTMPLKTNVSRWRRGRPILLMYKGCLTLFDSTCNTYTPYSRERTNGGGHTIGGFYHFDSLFYGYYTDSMNCFLMASDLTLHIDRLGRIKAGSGETWEFRYAMDYGNKYWARFFACSSKVQCLRNYNGLVYDCTHFNGVLIDHILHDPREYGLYPQKYAIRRKDSVVSFNTAAFQNDIYSFIETVFNEYHCDTTPPENPQRILAVGNCNNTYLVDTLLWKKYMAQLDGGMEENFAGTQKFVTVDEWKNLIWEMQYNESLGKIFFAAKKIQDSLIQPRDPFGVAWFDSTQMMYGFASYLMGCDSMSYFWFGNDYHHYYWAPILDIDIGRPLEQYKISGDTLAVRYFEKGVVFVNPTEHAVTAGTVGNRLLRVVPSNSIIDTVERFVLEHHTGAVCLYP